MENLIKQTADYFITKEHIASAQKAGKRAVKEIIFSGMSRCGFLKKFAYLKYFDHITKDNYYVCFLSLSPDNRPDADPFLSDIKDEAEAWGLPADVQKTDTGFVIELPEEYGLKRFSVFITSAELKDDVLEISYIQAPFPYELRYIESLPDDLASEIRDFYEDAIKNQAVKKPKKQEQKSPKEKASDQWIQPSLFDIFGQ